MHYLVTCGAGFIGLNFVERLARLGEDEDGCRSLSVVRRPSQHCLF